MTYWREQFYLTPRAEWKVFWWAITKSQLGIEDCLFTFHLSLINPIQINIPTYLIDECGFKAVGVEDWDTMESFCYY